MTYTLEIPVGNKRNGKKQFWAAKIAGTDPKWGFKREFLEPSDSSMSTKSYDLEDGVYNFVAYHGQEFIVVKNGEATEIKKEDILSHIQ